MFVSTGNIYTVYNTIQWQGYGHVSCRGQLRYFSVRTPDRGKHAPVIGTAIAHDFIRLYMREFTAETVRRTEHLL